MHLARGEGSQPAREQPHDPHSTGLGRYFTFRLRLLALVLLLLFPTFLLTFLTDREQRRHAAQDAEDAALRLVAGIADDQSRLVDEARMVLTLLAAPHFQSMPPAQCSAFLADLLADQTVPFQNLAIATSGGDIVCAARMPAAPLNVGDRAFFQRVLATRAFTSSDYMIGRIAGIPVMAFATPILAADGTIDAVAIASVDLGWLDRAIEVNYLSAGTALTVFDQNGTVLARHPDSTAWRGRSLPANSPLLQAVLASSEAGTLLGSGLDGTRQLAAFAPLPGLPTTPVFVLAEIPHAVAYAQVTEIWRRNLFWLGGMVLATLILAWGGGYLLIGRRVQVLVQTTQQLAAGDLSVRVGAQTPRDELGELAQAIDEMAASLERQVQEQARSEQALRMGEARLQTVVAAMLLPVAVSRVTDGKILFANEEFGRLHGLAVDDVLKRLILELYDDPLDRQKLLDTLARVGTVRGYEVQGKRLADGAPIWTALSVVPLVFEGEQALLMVQNDITARKEAEDQVRELETLYRHAIAAAGAVPYRKDERTHSFTFMGEGIQQLTGYAAEEMTPTLWSEICNQDAFHGELAGLTAEEAIAQVRLGMVDIWAADCHIRTRSGEERWVSDTSVELRDETGMSTGSIGLLLDVTERKRTEEELRCAKEEAEEAARVKADFLANMSHEIRTPLNAIIGMTGLLLDTPLSFGQREFAETIRSSGDSLLSLINDILDFSKIDSDKLELELIPFVLATSLEEALDLFSVQTQQKGLELGYLLDPNVPTTVIGDPGRLHQILTNLVGNAIKFTEQGEIVIRVMRDEAVPGLCLHFAVHDTGIGIPPEHTDRLFQSFSQVDSSITRKYGGTGLGLAISRRLSELMGGEMWVESTPGSGSTFHFTIQVEAAPAEYTTANLPSGALAGKRVLLVDDSPVSLDILTRQVKGWQMAPVAVSSGAEALALIEAGETFDLAILDRRMPDMDGGTLAAHLHRHPIWTELPIILLSSLGGGGELKDLKLAAVMTKPVKQTHLYRLLVSLLANLPIQEEPSASRFDATFAQRLPLRILLAEDNVVNQKVAVHMLARLGYRVDVAANGIEVLQALHRQPYDVILMDVQMPEMDGLEATRRICLQWPPEARPYIIAMTAHALTGDAERCFDAGMNAYLSKPVELERLIAALNQLSHSTAGALTHTPVGDA